MCALTYKYAVVPKDWLYHPSRNGYDHHLIIIADGVKRANRTPAPHHVDAVVMEN